MKLKFGLAWLVVLTLFLVFAGLVPQMAPVMAQPAVSKLGEYSGYSQPVYDGWVRTSQYVTVRDGTKLAVDIIRPTKAGVLHTEPLPVIWTHARYHRADIGKDGKLITVIDNYPMLAEVIKYGYVIGAVDVRGGGASFGTRSEPFDQPETWDAYDITEWFAAQPWCTGNIGMWGISYLGITQYMAASTCPPHLKAIFPEMACFDMYTFAYPNGVFASQFITSWGNITSSLDKLSPAAPVDEDKDGSMLKAAMAEHQANSVVLRTAHAAPYRNSWETQSNSVVFFTRSPNTYLSQIENSDVAVYILSGWWDGWARDQLAWFRNLDNPKKIIIGPWGHIMYRYTEAHLLAIEHVRWYDYWLKGIDNGIMEEPPIYYSTMGATKDGEWHSAWQWPLPNETPTKYYFRNGPSGSVSSKNDGMLSAFVPTDTNGKDDYVVDNTTTMGKGTRWRNMAAEPLQYPDMTSNDNKSLTYTTPPLASDMEITGHPVVHLWVSSTASDGSFFAYLEDVDETGVSNHISEGMILASDRAVSNPSFDYMGLPWHRCFKEDGAPLPSGQATELVFDLLPTSNIFRAGHRIRVTVNCADKDNFQPPVISPPPTVSIYRNAGNASYITLPIIPAGTEAVVLTPGRGTAVQTGSANQNIPIGSELPIVAIILAAVAVVAVIIVTVVLIMVVKRKPA